MATINHDVSDDDEEVSLSQIDKSIFDEIRSKAGSLDKAAFCKKIGTLYSNDIEDLNHVRKALYEEARRISVGVPYGMLIKRTNSGNSTAATKLIEDIYLLSVFHVVDGGFPPSEVKNVLRYRDRLHNADGHILDQSAADENESDNSELHTNLVENVINATECSMSNLFKVISSMRFELLEKMNDLETKSVLETNKLKCQINTLQNQLRLSNEQCGMLKSENVVNKTEIAALKKKIEEHDKPNALK